MKTRNLSIAAFVCGIVSIVSFFVIFFVGEIAILTPAAAASALVLGIVALYSIKKTGSAKHKVFALFGLISGIIMLALSLAIFVWTMCSLCVTAGFFNCVQWLCHANSSGGTPI